MKKLLMGFGITVLTILVLIGTSFAYTYDGNINPVEFKYWSASPAMPYESDVMVIELKNTTDRHTDVKVAYVYIVNGPRGSTVLAYQYQLKSTGETKYFELHPLTSNYDEVVNFDDGTFQERWNAKQQEH